MSQTSFTKPITGVPPVNLENVQGDIIYGLTKTHEHFLFFKIVEPDIFKENLSSLKFTTSHDVMKTREAILELKAKSPGERLQLQLLNVSFSQQGLNALGITEDLNDEAFKKGQFEDALELGDPLAPGDPKKPNWKPAYCEHIDGVFQAAGDTYERTNKVLENTLERLKGSIKEVYRLNGNTRPGDQRVSVAVQNITKHEHFGWQALDYQDEGARRNLQSSPQGSPLPAKRPYRARRSVILLGQIGDTVPDPKNPKNPRVPVWRPKWAFEGSIMVFRELQQLVPELDYFLEKTPFPVPLPPGQGKAILGSRLMGRWKNGVPVQLSPTSDDPKYLALDKINNFDYPQEPGFEGEASCPYSAHIRKMRPRNDIPEDQQEATRINRKGITYGPEVQPDEQSEHTTMYERGLAFVCYQSNMKNGFRRLQIDWANNPKFLFKTKHVIAGYDPIIGQTNEIVMPATGEENIKPPSNWVVPRGGGYFFTPSIKALKSVFSGKAYPE
ncbi:Dyp-type peroxidase family [Ceratobasidium sp. AG-Ba]|nr:Dyp-type peroxidase family [Ceratobasidium sp. AG-Ba]